MKKLIALMLFTLLLADGCAMSAESDEDSRQALTETKSGELDLRDGNANETDLGKVPSEEHSADSPVSAGISLNKINPEDVSSGKVPRTCRLEADFLSAEQATQLILERVSGATTDDFVELKLSSDDGLYVFEGELVYDRTECEFEINARTGEFISWETK